MNEGSYNSFKYCDFTATSDGYRTLYDKEGNSFCNVLLDKNVPTLLLNDDDLAHYRIIVRDNEIFLCSPCDMLIDKLCVIEQNKMIDTLQIPNEDTMEESLFQISTVHNITVVNAIKLYMLSYEYIETRKYIALDFNIIDTENKIKKIADCLPKVEINYEQK